MENKEDRGAGFFFYQVLDLQLCLAQAYQRPINQHISGLNFTDDARLFAGTANNTAKNIYKGWYTVPKY